MPEFFPFTLLSQTSIARDHVLYSLAQARFKFSAIIFN